jgi:hypothetical protein
VQADPRQDTKAHAGQSRGMDVFTQLLDDTLALGVWYERSPWAIDGLIYLVLFVGIAKVSLGSRYTGRGGAAVVSALGTALAIGASTLAYQSGFTLAQLGAVAWVILLTILCILIFDLARGVGIPILPAASIATLLVLAAMSGLGRSLRSSTLTDGLAGPLRVLTLTSLVVLLYWIVSLAGGRAKLHTPITKRPSAPRPDRSSAYRGDTDTAEQIERSVSSLIELAIRSVQRHGVSERTHRLLLEVGRRERVTKKLYGRVLGQLARRHWKQSAETQRLTKSVKALLERAKTNLSTFEKHLEVATAGQREGNAALLLQSLERMLSVERAGVSISQELRSLLDQLAQRRGGGSDGVR